WRTDSSNRGGRAMLRCWRPWCPRLLRLLHQRAFGFRQRLECRVRRDRAAVAAARLYGARHARAGFCGAGTSGRARFIACWGPWHNFQCKQYGRTLPTAIGIGEVGKILYYSHRGEFTPPAGFFFVVPRGVNRTLRRLISKPGEFRQALIDKWDEYCAATISEG